MTKRKWQMGIVGDRICIDLNGFDADLNKDLKASLPGPPRWDGTNKWWTFPLHWDTCVEARRVANRWDAAINIAPGLAEWAKNERARQATIPDVQSMELVDLPGVRASYPTIWGALASRPFQTVGAAFAARNRNCLIADQPGLGKTVQSIAAIVEAGITGPILVVAPKAAAKLVWPKELAHWVPGDKVVVLGAHLTPRERTNLVGEIKFKQELPGRLWVITSPNYLRIKAEVDQFGKYVYANGNKVIKAVGEAQLGLFDINWATVIVDESHQTLAGASGDKKKQSAQRVGLGAIEVREHGLRIALSGTPFRGKEEYLWGQLNWLRPDKYTSRWKWINQFFESYQDRYGMVIGGITDREAMYRDAASVMIRRTKAEVASDLPPKMYAGEPLMIAAGEATLPVPPEGMSADEYHVWYEREMAKLGPVAIWLRMDDKQLKAYNDIKRIAEAELEGGTLMTMGVLSELTRLKQFAGSYGKMVGNDFVPTLPSNKFDWVMEWLDERGMGKDKDKEAGKVVIASQFSSLIDAFANGFAAEGIKSFKFTGSTNDKDRQAIVDDWQGNPDSDTRILLMTTTAGGTGITLDAADDLITLDDTWDVSAMEQLEDRVHRLSRMHNVTIWPLRTLDSIEEGIARMNMERDTSIKNIIDGSRGVVYSQALLGGGK